MCSLHKWIEANKEKLSRGRPRKIKDINTHDLAQFIQGVSKIMELGDFPLFNSQMIFTFTKDHLSIEIINKQHANEKLRLKKKMMGIPDDVDMMQVANAFLETKGMDIKAASVNRAKIYGDLLNTNYDHVENILKIYNKIYSEFRLVESTRPYEKATVEEPKKNDQIQENVIQDNKENKLDDLEDYYGI